MKPILFVRKLTEEESDEVTLGLRSQDSFVLRRSQVISFSSEGLSIRAIAQKVGYHHDNVRKIINTFNDKGLAVLQKGSRRPHHIERGFSEKNTEKLIGLIHRSPRDFGKDSSLWTLDLLAEVSYEHGLTKKRVSDETVRLTLRRKGIRWKRAKHWLTSPDPSYKHKKNDEIG